MMLYDVLKASKGLYVNDSFAMLWGKQLGGWKIAELTGTLPMTFRADGTALINYRIYGTAEGAGVQMENVCPAPIAQTKTNGALSVTTDGQGRYDISISSTISTPTEVIFDLPEFTIPISVEQGGNGTFSMFNTVKAGFYVDFYYNDTQIEHWAFTSTNRQTNSYISMGNKKCNRIGFSISSKAYQGPVKCAIMFTNDGILPTSYIPYGYKLPLTDTDGTESKDTDIYIGDSKLLSGDYVDYESGKIVRNGTPQDPPLPLPAIETFSGTNTLDSTETLGEVTIKGNIKEA